MARKILVVDDDQDLVEITQSFLQKHGYEVVTARDGESALKILQSQRIDLITVDLNMPGLSGWHFTSRVRQDPNYQNTPIIVLSGLFQGDSEPESYEAANAHMAKPFDVFKLLDKIKALLNQSS